MRWAVFLKGVNVGGKTFRPTQLVRELPALDLVSIGAAGTFVTRRTSTPGKIRAAIRSRLPFDAEVLVVPGPEIRRVVTSDPLGPDRRAPGVRGFLAIAGGPLSGEVPLPLFVPDRENWQVEVRAVEGPLAFGMYRRLGTKLIYPTDVLEKRYGLTCTTRWWETVEEVARALASPDE